MGAGSSAKRQQGAVIQANQLQASAREEEEETVKPMDEEAGSSSMENVDEGLELHLLPRENTPKPNTPVKASRKPSIASNISTDAERRKALFSPPSKLHINNSASSLNGSVATQSSTPSPAKAHKIAFPPPEGTRSPPKSPATRQPINASNFYASSPLQQRLSEIEAQLNKKSEENGHLRNEIKLQQGVVTKLRVEKDSAVGAMHDALERCKSIEMEKDRVLTAFDAFRDGKEAELSALLRTKEELENRLLHAAQWRCAKCFSSYHPGIAEDLHTEAGGQGVGKGSQTGDGGGSVFDQRMDSAPTRSDNPPGPGESDLVEVATGYCSLP